MSTGLAIAATTAVLQSVLNSWIVRVKPSSVGDVGVTAIPPDRVPMGDTEPSSLNLFMYQAMPNPGWRNAGLPAYDSQGQRASNHPLAIDLHYLLTAYGKADFAPDILLGLGMQLLHEIPILTRDRIRRVFTPPSAPPGASLTPVLQALSTSGIAEQLEAIKITPHMLNTEEISKLWSVFQVAYRPTAAYQISVILIESRQAVKEALPVRETKLYVLPFEQPEIERVEPQILTYAPGAQLTLHGSNLRAENTSVKFSSGSEQTPNPENYTDAQLQVDLPSNIRAGVNTVQVVQKWMMGGSLHDGFESNVMAFSLRPVLQKVPVEGTGEEVYARVLNPQGSGEALRSGTMSVTLQPAVNKTQRAILLLNEANPPNTRAAHAYRFNVPSHDRPEAPDTTNTLLIPFRDVQAGDYLLRVRVDGAESGLEFDSENRPILPQVRIS